MTDYQDHAALVSGASSGIGLAIAQQLAARGALVAITGTHHDKLRVAAATFPDPDRVKALPFDVTDEAGWKSAVGRVESAWGPLRVLALNAGVGTGGELIEEVAASTWQWTWDVNVNGVVNGLRTCLPAMRQRALPARVLLTASVAGVWRAPTVGPYIVSKAAVVALAECLRMELANSPIQIAVLLPGSVRTDLAETSARSAPIALNARLVDDMRNFLAAGMDPQVVASYALERMDAGAFYIFTHRQVDDEIERRLKEMSAAMAQTLET